jgi:hypothetical protein
VFFVDPEASVMEAGTLLPANMAAPAAAPLRKRRRPTAPFLGLGVFCFIIQPLTFEYQTPDDLLSYAE